MKKKLISSVLAASVLLSMSGCSLFDSDNKAVLAVVDEYCQAILKADADDIVDVMVDGDDYEYLMNSFFDNFTRNKQMEDAYEAIKDSMSYKINKASAHSSKKDKKASVDVVYTMVDYEEIYDIVSDDDGDLDDFIDALEDDKGAHTIEIKQTVELKMKRDKWLVDDDDLDNFYEVYEFFQDVSHLSWCGFEEISIKQMENALQQAIGSDYQYNYYSDSASYYDYASYWGDEVSIYMYIYDDASDAAEEFEYFFYEDLVDDIKSKDFQGFSEYNFSGTDGYIIFDGLWYGDDYYGGFFFTGNMVLGCYTYSSRNSAKSTVDSFLNAIGYPTP